MNIGDLVTLSSRGKKLEACWRWTSQGSKDKQKLIGLVINIKDPIGYYENEKKFIIKWISEGPKGRTHWQPNIWHRHDLKFVSKAK